MLSLLTQHRSLHNCFLTVSNKCHKTAIFKIYCLARSPDVIGGALFTLSVLLGSRACLHFGKGFFAHGKVADCVNCRR